MLGGQMDRYGGEGEGNDSWQTRALNLFPTTQIYRLTIHYHTTGIPINVGFLRKKLLLNALGLPARGVRLLV